MLERFNRDAQATVKRAQAVAALEGSAAVEAEHVLIAMTLAPHSPAGQVLSGLGIGPDEVRRAIDAEFRAALQVVGVDVPPDLDHPRALAKATRWGESAKLALRRAAEAAATTKTRSIGSVQLLLALTEAQAGVMPGVLRELGVTAADVRAATGAAA